MKSKPFFDKMHALSTLRRLAGFIKEKIFLYVYGFVQKNMIKY